MKKMSFALKSCLAVVLTLFLFISCKNESQETENPTPPGTVEELKSAIEKVLEETKTPAAGIALVNQDGPVWIAGLGKADMEKDLDANENTMFRIGSVSKMFVALAILKLQEEGRLTLKDRVRDLIPEIWFENKWEDTHPVLVEHLLEHTTGWDDFHLAEFAHNDPAPVTLKEGLDFHPHSRTSRWIPGTRTSYCNSGPGVAAYIVEKITGQPFEEYIQNNFFQPMGMQNMTYFKSDVYNKLGATLYLKDKPQEYWHILMRPAGSINASPKDMAKMVMFFIHRGMADSMQLISDASLKRMETSLTTSGAASGIEEGYGLHNYTTPHKSFVYRSHNGGVNGGLTDFSYLPEHNVGYALMINSGDAGALYRISGLIRDFQTRGFEAKTVSPDSQLTGKHAAVSGYYRAINPRNQFIYFLEKILNVQRIWCSQDSIFQKGLLGGNTMKYLPADNNRFKSPETGLINMAFVTDPLAGEIIQSGGQALRRISMVQAYGQLIIGAWWLLFMAISVLLGLIWPFCYWRGQIKGGSNIRIRLWPLLGSLFTIIIILLVIAGEGDMYKPVGTVTLLSVSIMVLTIAFAITSAWSVFCILKERRGSMNRLIYWHSAILSALHLIVTVYLLWNGVIGMRTWA